MPRSSDSLSTVTSRRSTATPSVAARILISVASHAARLARQSQPGDGAEPPPPTDAGMSVAIVLPENSARKRSPLSITTVAPESVYRASAGWSVRYRPALSIAARISSSGIVIAPRLRDRRQGYRGPRSERRAQATVITTFALA